LLDIQQHLEGAYEDWQRFIRQNCEGPECQRIWHQLNSRRAKLAAAERLSGCAAEAESHFVKVSARTALSVMIVAPDESGGQFTLLPNPDGRSWTSSAFVLQEELRGWRLSDLRKSDHFYWKEKLDDNDLWGMYFPCAMCPDDGWALVAPATTATEVPPGTGSSLLPNDNPAQSQSHMIQRVRADSEAAPGDEPAL
jgi:hypothetical protein